MNMIGALKGKKNFSKRNKGKDKQNIQRNQQVPLKKTKEKISKKIKERIQDLKSEIDAIKKT